MICGANKMAHIGPQHYLFYHLHNLSLLLSNYNTIFFLHFYIKYFVNNIGTYYNNIEI